MSDKKDKKPALSKKDKDLWQRYVEQEKIEGPTIPEEELSFEDLMAAEDERKEAPQAETPNLLPKKSNKPSISSTQAEKSNEIDRRTAEKLRKGQLSIEARCDLHGLNQVQARQRLENFIIGSVAKGKRCVLVITGKGRSLVATDAVIEPELGVLKQKLPEWLNSKPISSHILRYYPAKPKDGGSGAMYVYLRKGGNKF
ncbi:MAG: Smr/MutS family protein [Pseudomonadota bacterium]